MTHLSASDVAEPRSACCRAPVTSEPCSCYSSTIDTCQKCQRRCDLLPTEPEDHTLTIPAGTLKEGEAFRFTAGGEPDDIEKRIAALESECGNLTDLYSFSDEKLFVTATHVPWLLAQLHASRQREKRYRESLHDIVFYEKEVHDYEPLDAKAADEIVKIAKAALSPRPHE